MKHGHRGHSGNKPGDGRPGAFAHGPTGGQRGSDQDENEIAQILKSTKRIELWSGSNRRTLRPELLDSEARERAKELRGVASSQLYRFYATAVAFKQRLQIDQQVTDGEVEAQIAYLKASSAYSGARRQAKEQAKALPLVEFFAAAANSVRTREDYIGFTRHFEAIMAFHKVFEEKRTDG